MLLDLENPIFCIKHRISHHSSKSQAILAKAFRGELVPTEVELARLEGREYETATELLERTKERT